ncbi:MAG: hypothetical protein HZB25_10525 [Candidatus Eisenbacteria bacterium]|nr:hypothetical protein [Candidatus Eisenbacteria bacterium]
MKSWVLVACVAAMLCAASSGMAITSNVAIRSNGFSPAVDTVNVHDVVRWTNQDASPHAITCSAAGEAFDSGDMAVGGTYQRSFNRVGTFRYQCSAHAGMQGTIVVISQSPVQKTTWGHLKQLFRTKGVVPGLRMLLR